jgi:SAM-dependent methyltransferase
VIFLKDKIDIVSLNKAAWNKIAKRYEDEHIGKINPSIEFFCEKLPKRAYILDLGSGTGLPYAKLFVERGFKVLGIDVSAEMIKLARKNVPKAQFKEKSMTELDYHSEFDGAFSSYSMLLLDPTLFQETAKKIVSSLKNGGLFYLSLNEPWVEDVDVNSDVIIEIMGEKMYSRAYSKEEILNIFNPLGMRLLKFHREIITSKTFGKENMNTYIFMLE